MAIPLLAFYGLGLGAKMGLDALAQSQAERYAQQQRQRAATLMGTPGAELAGPVQPGAQPLMSPGTGLMGGQLSPLEYSQEMMALGGPYAEMGQDLQKSLLEPRNVQTVTGGGSTPGSRALYQMGPSGGTRVPGVPEWSPAPPAQININQGPKLPANYQWADPSDPSKGVKPIPGGPAEQSIEAERTAAGYVARMETASQGIEGLVAQEPEEEDQGFLKSLWSAFTEGPTEDLDVAGARMALGRMMPDFAESAVLNPSQQQYLQYARDWIRAKLRKESGAVINQDEWTREYQTYFPMLGDSPEVIKQKQKSRKEAEKSMKISAGKAYKAPDTVLETYTDPNTGDIWERIGDDPNNPDHWRQQ